MYSNDNIGITHKKLEDKDRVAGATNEVNHPSHYQHIKIGHKGKNIQKYEVIDIIQGIVSSLDLGSDKSGLLWQSLKYIMRSPYKDNELQDLEKAEWYLSRLIDLEKRKQAAKSDIKPGTKIVTKPRYRDTSSDYYTCYNDHNNTSTFDLPVGLRDKVLPYLASNGVQFTYDKGEGDNDTASLVISDKGFDSHKFIDIVRHINKLINSYNDNLHSLAFNIPSELVDKVLSLLRKQEVPFMYELYTSKVGNLVINSTGVGAEKFIRAAAYIEEWIDEYNERHKESDANE